RPQVAGRHVHPAERTLFACAARCAIGRILKRGVVACGESRSLMHETEFGAAFTTITGNPPFPWQRELYQLFLAGNFPASCSLPTGLGKTTVIHIWLLALAHAPIQVPRRLVYVVNRRTVVDQSTDEARKLRECVESGA